MSHRFSFVTQACMALHDVVIVGGDEGEDMVVGCVSGTIRDSEDILGN